MLKQKYFLTGIFILSAERQPIKLAWRKIVWLHTSERVTLCYRALVVDTNYKLIYYVDANKDVIIVTVWDVRQNPDKLTKTIE